MDFFSDLDPAWCWLAAGFALAGLEMVVPGVYLIWIAVAAIITGLVSFAADISLWAQIALFAVFALNSIFLARRWSKDHYTHSDDPLLNDKAGRLVGEMAVVTQPIEGGEGRAKIGDSEWIARGPDMPAGTRARVLGVDGAMVLLERDTPRGQTSSRVPA